MQKPNLERNKDPPIVRSISYDQLRNHYVVASEGFETYHNESNSGGIKSDIFELETVAIARLDWHTAKVAIVFKRDLKELQIMVYLVRDTMRSIGSIRFNKRKIKDVRVRKGM